jgi:hypothetical protein
MRVLAEDLKVDQIVIENKREWRVKKFYEIPSGMMGGRLAFTLEAVLTEMIWRFHCSKKDFFTLKPVA